jgi:hypothetical protein
VSWQSDYEPFVVVAVAVAPPFDTRFVGFGWNKVWLICDINRIGLLPRYLELSSGERHTEFPRVEGIFYFLDRIHV